MIATIEFHTSTHPWIGGVLPGIIRVSRLMRRGWRKKHIKEKYYGKYIYEVVT